MTHETEIELTDEQLTQAVGGHVTGRITGVVSDPTDPGGTVLSSGANTLGAGTYGRSVFALHLNDG